MELQTTTQSAQPEAEDAVEKRRNDQLLSAVAACRSWKRQVVDGYTTSIDYRRGKPYVTDSDEHRIAVNKDWPNTQKKIDLLFSQVPKVYVDHPPQTVSKETDGWLFRFEQVLNDSLRGGGIEAAMDEVLPDCINAAGFGAVLVSYDAITRTVAMPAVDLSRLDPALKAQVLQTKTLPDGSPLPTIDVPQVLDKRYMIERISPFDFIWDTSFRGSDFNKCPIVGREGQLLWYEAKARWNLTDTDKAKYVTTKRRRDDLVSKRDDSTENSTTEYVQFTELFVIERQFADSDKFNNIRHVVFLSDEKKPITDEPWKGQYVRPDGVVIGSVKRPIQVLTLAYVTDDPMPPSDSSVARPLTDELNKIRSQMIMQREYSRPWRWADALRMDPTIFQAVLKGDYQRIVPTMGDGSKMMGEIPRSAYPQDNYSFERYINNDMTDVWNLGQNTSGANVETKGEANVLAGAASTTVARQRAKVSSFVCRIAEVLGGLICIYEEPDSFGEGFDPEISKTLAYSIIADSTVLLTVQQRLQRLIDFLNFAAKSPQVNEEPILREIAQLTGLDPSAVIVPPKPRPPVEPNISLRLTGSEDLINPLVMGFLEKSGQSPSIEDIQAGMKKIQAAAMAGPAATAQAVTEPPMGIPPPDGMPPMGEGLSPQPVLGPGENNPSMHSYPKVNERIVERPSSGDE